MNESELSPIRESHQSRAVTCRHCKYQYASVWLCLCACYSTPLPFCPACGCPSALPLNVP